MDVVRVSSRTGEGVEELWKAAADRPLRRSGQEANEETLLAAAQEALAHSFAAAQRSGDNALTALLAEWQAGRIDKQTALRRLFSILALSGQQER